ncbi:hypothetical protein ACE6H2_009331 [Prunus campanulata]
MLMNMVGPFHERLEKNVTFLIPNDQMQSEVVLPVAVAHEEGDTVMDFLLRHSIPSPLLFEYLEHIPTDGVLAPLAPPPPPLPPPDQNDDSCSDKAHPASSSSVDDNPNTPAAVPASPQTDPANLKSSAAASSLFLSSHEQGHCLRMSLTSCAILLSIFISMI